MGPWRAARGFPVWFRRCRLPDYWRGLSASELAVYGFRELQTQTGKPWRAAVWVEVTDWSKVLHV